MHLRRFARDLDHGQGSDTPGRRADGRTLDHVLDGLRFAVVGFAGREGRNEVSGRSKAGRGTRHRWIKGLGLLSKKNCTHKATSCGTSNCSPSEDIRVTGPSSAIFFVLVC